MFRYGQLDKKNGSIDSCNLFISISFNSMCETICEVSEPSVEWAQPQP